MFTATIGVYARLKSNIWTVVVAYDRAAPIVEELRAGQGIIVRIPIAIGLQMKLLESVRRITARAAGRNRRTTDLAGAHAGSLTLAEIAGKNKYWSNVQYRPFNRVSRRVPPGPALPPLRAPRRKSTRSSGRSDYP